MPKFYFTTLAARPMKLGGREFRFAICSMGSGRATGVYEATDEAEIAILDDAVRGRRGVKEIAEAEFEELKKKASQTPQFVSSSGSKPPRVVQIPTLPEMAIEARPGVPSAGLSRDGKQKPLEELPPSPSIGSLLRVKRVNPPQPFAGSVEKTKRASNRADRAKIRVARKAE